MSFDPTPDEVKSIMETSLTDSQVQSFIDLAVNLLDEVMSGAGYSDQRLHDIKLALSCHFALARAGRVSRKKIGDASIDYRNPGDALKGLFSTFYGQQALLLDTSGRLQSLGRRKFVFKTAIDHPDAV